MNKQEFCDRVKILSFQDIDENDWDTISTVYTYHPVISNVNGKDEIAALYSRGGMTLIHDMYDRADRIRNQEIRIQETKVEMENAEKQHAAELAEMQAAHDDRMADMRQRILDSLKEVDRLENKNKK